MRTVWKGSISFGLVSIPVKVVAATESHSVSFRQVHTRDTGRIRYRKVCEAEGEEVPNDEIGRAYETADGGLVPLSDADFDSLPLPSTRTVDILGFVALDSIDPYQLDRSYYLTPDPGATKPYVLLREALRRSEKGAIAKVAMRGRETLALLRALDGQGREVLGMHTLLWPDEIRSAAELGPTEQVTVRDAELDMADTLMDTLGTVAMEELHDEYREAVDALVSAKLAGTEPERPREPAPTGGQVVDLMAALEDSVRSARRTRGSGGGEDAEDRAETAPRKRTSSRGTTKQTQKKAASKKTSKTSKKTPAKKPGGGRRAA
ncbi:non-homologous end joining protein Ku [Streptomyces sp. 4N509B]|uniref:non-homologous end joining protein Ku n=1 Tax=Streptomyces sp. 4N509B TaxID=3457413 RepID=UPI003FD1E5AE